MPAVAVARTVPLRAAAADASRPGRPTSSRPSVEAPPVPPVEGDVTAARAPEPAPAAAPAATRREGLTPRQAPGRGGLQARPRPEEDPAARPEGAARPARKGSRARR